MNKLINQMFDDLFPMTTVDLPKKSFNRARVPVNIIENTDMYKIQLAIPGVSKEDVQIEIENLGLTISYEAAETKNEDDKFLRQDFIIPSFKRSFNLSEQIDTDNIKAQFINGILNISLPKKAPATPEKKKLIID